MKYIDNKIIIYPNKLKYVLLSIFSLVWSLVGMFIIIIGLITFNTTTKENYGSSFFVLFLGIVCFAMFLSLTLFYIRRVNKPSLSIDERGIYYNISRKSEGHLSWAQIKSICIYNKTYKYYSQNILGIELKNGNEFSEVNKLINNYPVNIPERAIDINIEKLYRLVESYLNKNDNNLYSTNTGSKNIRLYSREDG